MRLFDYGNNVEIVVINYIKYNQLLHMFVCIIVIVILIVIVIIVISNNSNSNSSKHGFTLTSYIYNEAQLVSSVKLFTIFLHFKLYLLLGKRPVRQGGCHFQKRDRKMVVTKRNPQDI